VCSSDLVWKTPSTLVMELMTRHRGASSVACEARCPVIASPAMGNQPAFDAVPVIDAAVTYDHERRTAYASIVNRHPDDPDVWITLALVWGLGVQQMLFPERSEE